MPNNKGRMAVPDNYQYFRQLGMAEKLMSNVNNKRSFASLWFSLYPPAELDNRVVGKLLN